MQELRPGLWTWTAPHPEWTPEQGGADGWDRDVRSYVYDSGSCLALFDPLSPPTLLDRLVESQDLAVLITCSWHRRSADECATRFGAHVHAADETGDLPGGVERRPAGEGEVAFWIADARALVFGDAILGTQGGVRVKPDGWLGETETHESIRETLRALLELPVELVLPTHGEPVTEDARGALAAALAS